MNKFLLPSVVLIIAVSFFLLFFFLYDLRKEVTYSKEDIKHEISSGIAEKSSVNESINKGESNIVAKVEETLSKIDAKKSALNKNKNSRNEDLRSADKNDTFSTRVENKNESKSTKRNELLKEIIMQEKQDFEKEKWLEYLRTTYLSAKKAFIETMVERLGLMAEQKDNLMKIIAETVEDIVSIYKNWYESDRGKEADIIFRENIHQCTLSESERIKNVLTINQISGYEDFVNSIKKISTVEKFIDKK